MATEEAAVRLYQVRAAIAAAEQFFGKEAADSVLAAMSPEFQRVVASVETSMSWTPVRHLIEWSLGVWEAPAGRDRDTMVAYTRLQLDEGFGRIRRAILKVVSPRRLLERAPELWNKDNRGGSVTVEVGDQEGTWTLTDHPYCELPHARASMAEVLRYCLELTRARDVTETHGLYDGSLRVVVRWR